MSTAEELVAELETLTNVSPADWYDFMACSPAEQALIAQGYRDMSWAKVPDRVAQVLTILETIGAIAGVVGGVAGAAGAIMALKAVL